MRTVDRIRKYISDKKAEGQLVPGDKLPSYHELMGIGKGSYATVLSAMKQLQNEGLIEIRNGAGSFISGGKPLKISILHNPQMLSEQNFAAILNRHLDGNMLNLELKFHSTEHLCTPEKYQQFINREQAAIIVNSPLIPSSLPMANLSEFEGYDELNKLHECSGDAFRLPFLMTSKQFAMNPKIVKKAGFDIKRMNPSFGWWNDYVKSCRSSNIHSASMMWSHGTISNFSNCYCLLLALTDLAADHKNLMRPLFSTTGGRRFLQMLKDQHYYTPNNRDGSFFKNEAGINFHTGSWIATQNKSQERPDINVDKLEIIPLSRCGKNIKLVDRYYLSAYFGKDATVEERKRVWSLMSLMSGRDFQLDYCNASGMISARSDISRNDYEWNRSGAWDVFFAEKNDLTIYEDELFGREKAAALTLLLEDFLFYGADKETVLRRMDQKIRSNDGAFDPHTGISNY